MRLRPTVAAVATLALLAACSPEAEAPPTPVREPTAAPQAAATAPPISYACESGQSVAVAYPDTATAQVTYKGQAYTLRTTPSASGARYAGSGMEWWTQTMSGQESATLSRLGPNEDVGVAVLERCGRPSSGPVVAGPGQTSPIEGGPVQGAALTPPAAMPCKGPQLKLSADGGDAGMSNRVSILGVQNIGTQACSLSGYPTVALQDAQGRALTAVRSEQTPGSYFRAGQAPTPVNLAPQGKAFFDIAWNVAARQSGGCPAATRIRVTAPGDTSPVSLDQAIAPCGGRIQVSPFRPVAEPAPPAATTPAPSKL